MTTQGAEMPEPVRQLEGRRIIITGASAGIGRATAELFARHGARLTLFDREPVDLALPLQNAMVLDVTDELAVADAVARAAADMGGIDGLVNVAGVFPVARIEDTTLALWQRTLEVNATGPFLMLRAAVPHLRAAGRSTVVNLGSASAIVPYGELGAYGASKGALSVASKVWAAELGPEIRVNVIAPGMTRTRMVSDWYPDTEQLASRAKALYALQRIAEPSEIAEGILFLSSHASSVITGTTLVMDGGRTFH
ncbi:SDR family NAD(P)-dependent oxidoreductase [Castellaniella sp.]|uniref:SDR family NAD(P)-dependent oxidoreductase n=1 Tax=Castellaniella sp. TaxID=1955812 RepID=UPI0035609C30